MNKKTNKKENLPKEETPKKEVPESEIKKYKSRIKAMKAHLDSQPKISFLIPLMPGEKEGAFETVILNGYRYTIKKGVMVRIPKQVAEILSESYKIQMSAGSDKLVSRDEKTQEALG